MAGTEQVIHLQGNEDIHALRTLVARAQGERVLLVVPNNHAALRGLVRLRLLVRQAHDVGKELALVTRDRQVRQQAEQLNLSVFPSVVAGQRARRWRRGEVAMPGSPAAVAGGAAVMPESWRTGREGVLARRDQIGRGGDWGERIAFLGLGIGVFVVLLAVFLLIIPSAEVTLIPRQEPLEVTMPMTIAPDAAAADFSTGQVPGNERVVTVEAAEQIPTSGRMDVPDAPARVRVTFINRTGQEIQLPANTIVGTTSAAPVKFRTTEPITIPNRVNERVNTMVEAIQPGLTGNVSALQINQIEGPAGAVLRVLNEGPGEGGTVKQVAVVTAADKEQLLAQLTNRMRQEALAELLALTPAEEFFVPETLTLEPLTETFDRGIDEQADTLQLTLRVRARGLSLPRIPVERMGRQALVAQLQSGFQLLEDGFRVVPQKGELAEDGTVSVPIEVAGFTAAQLDGSLVRGLVRGLPADEAQSVLLQRLPLAADPAIEVQPSWWGRLPYLPLRIFVRVAALPVNAP